jgi:hypothetical protein
MERGPTNPNHNRRTAINPVYRIFPSKKPEGPERVCCVKYDIRCCLNSRFTASALRCGQALVLQKERGA